MKGVNTRPFTGGPKMGTKVAMRKDSRNKQSRSS